MAALAVWGETKLPPQWLRLILRNKPCHTGRWLIATVLGDVALEHAKDVVISHDMVFPVGTRLSNFRVSA